MLPRMFFLLPLYFHFVILIMVINMEKTLNSQCIYDGKILQLYRDEVLLPHQQTGIREVVHHHGGVGILAIKNQHILLVKQYRYPFQKETIEIPAGKIEANEEPLKCAYRELEEETGYGAHDMALISSVLPTPGYSDECIYLYEAKQLYRPIHPLPKDDDEFIQLIEMPITEAYQAVLSNMIQDAKTVIAIMYAYLHYAK